MDRDTDKVDKAVSRSASQLSSALGPAWDTPISPRIRGPPRRAISTSDSTSSPVKRGTTSGQDSAAMSSRGNQRRGPNRNSEISQHGEEVIAWKEVKDQLPSLVDMFNQSSANVSAMYEQDKLCAEKKKNGCKCASKVSCVLSRTILHQSC